MADNNATLEKAEVDEEIAQEASTASEVEVFSEPKGCSSEYRAPLWRLFFAYTVSFAAIVPFVFWVFWRYGFSLIHIFDAWSQHVKSLAYYGIYLRDVAHLWLSGDFSLPTFSTSFGYGADLLTTLQYYVIGDPLNLLAIFVTPEHTESLYGFLIILRLYLAGLFFALAMRYLRRTETAGIVLAAIVYAFSAWMLVYPMRHPFFATPLIVFPLVIWGVEKGIRERKYLLLVGAVAASAIVNFYFFYMIVLLTACYVLVRLVAVGFQQSWRESGRRLLGITVASVGGVLLSAFALLPVILSFLGSSRVGVPINLPALYPNAYYKEMYLQFAALSPKVAEGAFAKAGEGAYVYAGPLALLALLWLFVRLRGHWVERVLVVVAGVFFAFPVFGHLFNGMSYPTGRWSFGYVFLAAYLICVLWDEIWDAPRTEIRNLAILAGGYILLAAFVLHRTESPERDFVLVSGFLFLAMCMAIILYFHSGGSKIAAKTALAFVSAGAVVLTSYWTFSATSNHFAEKGLWERSLSANEAAAVVRNAGNSGDTPTRFEGIFLTWFTDNTSILSGVSSTEFYWSIDQTHASELYDSLAISDNISFNRRGVDGRSILATLIGAEYRVGFSTARTKPYGYTEIDQFDDVRTGFIYSLYKTPYSLPLGYTYTHVISKEDWDRFSPSEKEEAMLHGVWIEEDTGRNLPTISDEELGARTVPYTLSVSKKAVADAHHIETSANGQSVKLDFDTGAAGEVHLRFKGVDTQLYDDMESTTNVTVTFDCAGHKVNGRAHLLTEDYTWYEGRDDYVVNSRYCEGPVTGATIKFPKPTRVSFDSLEVWAQPLEGFEEAVGELSAEKLENVDMRDIGLSRATDEITGEVTVSEPKILVLTIPKTDGWTAYVDGKEHEILTANAMWMGLELEPGHHDIKFVYHTPGLRLGAIISITTLLGICVVCVVRRKRLKGPKSSPMQKSEER